MKASTTMLGSSARARAAWAKAPVRLFTRIPSIMSFARLHARGCQLTVTSCRIGTPREPGAGNVTVPELFFHGPLPLELDRVLDLLSCIWREPVTGRGWWAAIWAAGATVT